MGTFSIDDVRETFTSDVTSLLAKIEEGAQFLLGSTGLVEPGGCLADGRPGFDVLADVGHAIAGTTSLVGVDSLTDSARALEELARSGQQAVFQLQQGVARCRDTARLCLEGVGRMRSMLELELAHRSSEALWESLELIDAINNRTGGVARKAAGDGSGEGTAAPTSGASEDKGAEPAVAAPPPSQAASAGNDPPSAFAFELDPAGGAGEPAPVFEEAAVAPELEDVSQFAFEEDIAPSSVGFELRQVFDEEAREALQAVRRELRALADEPTNVTTAGNLERLFHTLKGAAATVGLKEVSASAARLQGIVEDLVESGAPATPEFCAGLLAKINQMLIVARIPALSLDTERPGEGGEPASAVAEPAATAEPDANLASLVATPTPPPAPVPDAAFTVEQAHGFFLEEARQIIEEAGALLVTVGGSDPASAERGRADLARIFHRLKGSALIVGEAAISDEAERLQKLFEQGIAPREEAVPQTEAGLAAINASLVRAVAIRQPAVRVSPGKSRRAMESRPVRQAVKLEVNPEIWEAFLHECKDLLEATDKELLALEETDQPKLALESLMRHCHTLKGVVNTVGLAPTGEMLHKVEDLLEGLLAAAILPPMKALATLLIGVQGDVRKHLRQAKDGWVETDMPRLEGKIARLLGKPRALGEEGAGASLAGMTGGHTGIGPTEQGASIHSIHSARSLRSARSVEAARSNNPHSHDDELDRRYIRVATDRLDALMNLAGELVVSRSRLLSRVVSLRSLQQGLGFGSRRLLQTVEEFREDHEFGNLGGRRRRPGTGTGTGTGKASASNGRHAVGAAAASAAGGGEMEHFGELEFDQYEDIHILSRRLTEMTGDFNEVSGEMARSLAAFNDDSDVFGRIVTGIQSEITRARMVPLDQLFTRLKLPVRDAASREAKEVRVVVEGADVHIDKTIADSLMQPMLHLVRNAVVHGVESGPARERVGKAATGTITLRARQESGQIVVEVSDDGGGLDLERLRARGVQMGVIAAETPLSDPAVRDLVFVAGLSTRAQAGAVSGRGVGCDVVRRSVERLNGTIRVESTQGRGTTFVVTLPVTLAITKALIVRHADRTYAIPLHFAERIIDAEEEAIIHSAGIHRIKVEGTFLTVGRLDQHFGVQQPTPSTTGPVLMLRVGASRTALQVDAVLGQEEVVVKSMGDILTGHPLFAGVTIRGSGELVLIVDVPGLVEKRGEGVEGRARRAPALRREAPEAAAAGEGGEASAEDGEAREAPAAAPATAAVPTGPLKVLFVDDSLSVRKFAQMTLASLGVEVTLAVDGVDGMAKLREGNFDLVFTDLEMPRMHGFELIRELRFLPLYHDLPIVVVTSRSGHKHQQQARTLGATEYLTKPFNAQSLKAVLEKWGRQRHRGQGPSKAPPVTGSASPSGSPAASGSRSRERKPS
jgi:chemosensory pili system protein ChpA (sensor histidine kinase/response regulator)